MTPNAYAFIAWSAFLVGGGLLVVRWWLIPRLRAISGGRQEWWQSALSIALLAIAIASFVVMIGAVVFLLESLAA